MIDKQPIRRSPSATCLLDSGQRFGWPNHLGIFEGRQAKARPIWKPEKGEGSNRRSQQRAPWRRRRLQQRPLRQRCSLDLASSRPRPVQPLTGPQSSSSRRRLAAPSRLLPFLFPPPNPVVSSSIFEIPSLTHKLVQVRWLGRQRGIDWFRFLMAADHCRFSSLRARATSSSEESSGSGDELLADLKEKVCPHSSCILAFFSDPSSPNGLSDVIVITVGFDREQIYCLIVWGWCNCCGVAIFRCCWCHQLGSSGTKISYCLDSTLHTCVN